MIDWRKSGQIYAFAELWLRSSNDMANSRDGSCTDDEWMLWSSGHIRLRLAALGQLVGEVTRAVGGILPRPAFFFFFQPNHLHWLSSSTTSTADSPREQISHFNWHGISSSQSARHRQRSAASVECRSFHCPSEISCTTFSACGLDFLFLIIDGSYICALCMMVIDDASRSSGLEMDMRSFQDGIIFEGSLLSLTMWRYGLTVNQMNTVSLFFCGIRLESFCLFGAICFLSAEKDVVVVAVIVVVNAWNESGFSCIYEECR